MSLYQNLLWLVLPYMSLTIFLMGLIWRTKSEEADHGSKQSKFIQTCCVAFAGLTLITGILSLFLIKTGLNIFSWFLDLILLQPNIEYLQLAPISLKIFIISFCLMIISLSFSQFINKLFVWKGRVYSYSFVTFILMLMKN